MLRRYLARGLTAGLAAGAAFGAFVALVGTPLVELAERVAGDAGHDHGGHAASEVAAESAHAGHEATLPELAGTLGSVGGGALWGVFAGVLVFGVGYYLLEPALPGAADTRSYLLAGAGFLVCSAAPWLALPPQPAGAAVALSPTVRIGWYAGMMTAGAVACALAAVASRRLSAYGRAPALAGAALALALLAIPAAFAPATGTGDTPAALVAVHRGVVVTGQLGLWALLGVTHAWVVRRDERGRDDGERSVFGTPAD